ncbi:hypothetical protein OCF65_12380 [Bacillus toyonensis]|nr:MULTISPECIES: hypothetical protein [Bacillus cereus group]MCU4767827.1 hypothetical protein [Bacillus toyonensis]MCU5581281.1 hypothetical protein [Bacillus toyonensis]
MKSRVVMKESSKHRIECNTKQSDYVFINCSGGKRKDSKGEH